MPQTEYAHVHPRLFVTKSEGKLLVGLTNLSGGQSIYIHKERHSLRGCWTISFGITMAPLEWQGGELWISASADDTPFQRLVGEVGRAVNQQRQAAGEGQSQPQASTLPAAPPPVILPTPSWPWLPPGYGT